MFKKNFNMYEANNFVKTALEFVSELTELTIETTITEDGHVEYCAKYIKYENGQNHNAIMVINNSNYISLMQYGMELKGYTVGSIKPRVNDGSIKYQCMIKVVDDSMKLKKVGRLKKQSGAKK